MNFNLKNGLSVYALMTSIVFGSFGLGGFAIYKDSPRFFETTVELRDWFRFAFRSGMDSKPKSEALPDSTQLEANQLKTQPVGEEDSNPLSR